jgi:thioredoxin 1
MSVKKISTSEFNEKVLGGTGKCVVDFSATWCGPCRMLAPILEEISEEETGTAFYNIDVDEESQLAAKYGVMSVPTVIVFENGSEKTHFIGLRSKEDIKAML